MHEADPGRDEKLATIELDIKPGTSGHYEIIRGGGIQAKIKVSANKIRY